MSDCVSSQLCSMPLDSVITFIIDVPGTGLTSNKTLAKGVCHSSVMGFDMFQLSWVNHFWYWHDNPQVLRQETTQFNKAVAPISSRWWMMVSWWSFWMFLTSILTSTNNWPSAPAVPEHQLGIPSTLSLQLCCFVLYLLMSHSKRKGPLQFHGSREFQT